MAKDMCVPTIKEIQDPYVKTEVGASYHVHLKAKFGAWGIGQGNASTLRSCVMGFSTVLIGQMK